MALDSMQEIFDKAEQGQQPFWRVILDTDLEEREVTEEGSMEKPYAAMAMGTSLEMKGLTVVDIYTTTNEDSSMKGAMTLTCYTKGYKISVRTTVMRDADGNLITADAYEGKIINVKGVVDVFSGTYQIKVFSPEDITIIG